MKRFCGKLNIVQVQGIAWAFFFLIIMVTLLQNDSAGQAFTYALLNTVFYAIIVYGNISWLFPKLYQRGFLAGYIAAAVTYLVAIGAVRGFVTWNIYNTWFAMKREPLTIKIMLNFVSGGVVVFLFSYVLRIALAYFALKKQQEETLAQKARAELDLLKSQVQPHFLFNTLNNIYYEAYKEAPRTAALIEKLSDIMRYFVDESPKQTVPIDTEVQFIENYIALEKIRIRYPVELTFAKNVDLSVNIPPMLFMTFVENIFKHGIDKSSAQNRVSLSLLQTEGHIIFKAENTLPKIAETVPASGFGIQNLRKRLQLLYGDRFELHTQTKGDIYSATLTIPVS